MTEKKAKSKAKAAPPANKSPRPAAKLKKPRPASAKAKSVAAASGRAAEPEASRKIDEQIRSLGDWRGETLAEVRRLIHEADPEIVEEWKWMGTPVWSHAGNVCTGETYKQVVKLTFARGASLDDPERLFNSSLEGSMRRAIDIRAGEALNSRALQALIRAAVAENLRTVAEKTKSPAKTPGKATATAKVKPAAREAKPGKAGKSGQVVLLSGGNPQIAKADGDAAVQAYIAAMPDWKSELGRRLDALIVRTVPQVGKAVRWNSPFYGVEGQGWFLSFHVFARYVKVTFFSGMSLRPIPPGGTERSKEVRWIDIYADKPLDEAQMAAWIKQAAALPGWIP